MKALLTTWQPWALASALFAAMTAILAKVGVAGVNADFATLVRTAVVLIASAGVVVLTGQWQAPTAIAGRTYLFLVLSGLATGASWLCYFRALKIGDAARVAPVDKLSVVLVGLFAAIFLGEKLSSTNWIGLTLVAVGAVLVAL